MPDVSRISQFDLYFFVLPATGEIVARAGRIGSLVVPTQGPDWATRLSADGVAYRGAVELYLREVTETTDAIRTVDQLASNVSQWRRVAENVARNAPAPRREVLLQAAGYGLGSARSVKEMKDLLLTLKSRVGVHGAELVALGLSPLLLDLPARVLTTLEGGAGDVAREKAEDSKARADVAELAGRLVPAITAAWRAAETVALQAELLAARNEASEAERQALRAEADEANALATFLDKALAEACVAARARAAKEQIPPELVDAPRPAGGTPVA